METKFYYSYNAEGNAYVGKYQALKNPRRQTEYLLPAMATFKEPPTAKENEVAIWNGKDWEIVSDYRGQTQINIEIPSHYKFKGTRKGTSKNRNKRNHQ